MIRLDVIEMADPTAEALADLKRYAGVADDGQDGVLIPALRNAFGLVQRAADTALLAGRWRVSADEHPGVVKVYMGGKVDGVTDHAGNPVSFNQRGNRVWLGTDGYVQVEFTTTVTPADYARLLPVVCEYATAIYDGQDSRTLNNILKQCL